MVDIYEHIRRLKPILGPQADNYLYAYLSSDEKGKKEILQAIELMSLQLLGPTGEHDKSQLSVPLKEKAEGEYYIGDVSYAGKTLYPVSYTHLTLPTN